MKRLASIGLAGLLCLFAGVPAFSYLSNYTSAGSGQFQDKWARAPQWNMNPARNSNMQGSRSVAEVIQASFNTWMAAPGTAVSAQRGADSTATSAGFNNQNLICFVCQGDFSKEAETLAVTISTTSTQMGVSDGRGGQTQFVGQMLDSDILFNPSRTFSTDGVAPDADGIEDLQTVATHEIGHFFGMDHSAVVRAMMFPYSPSNQRLLSYDDVAGIAIKYPNGSQATGVIAGSVRLNGGAVFGAHVYAESQTVAEAWAAFNVRKSPISTLSLPDGSYRIEGLPSDVYSVTAEPLDLPVVNKDVQDYADAFGRGAVQTGFTTRWY
ncbi:MAG TPA: matrixin family metalloprotease [Terriglobales bacterium]|nr:matrixin family metalloprotease [Terriglobales bacterium]